VETDLAHEIGQTLADWYEENGREGDSAQINLSLSAWQTLRDAKHDLPPPIPPPFPAVARSPSPSGPSFGKSASFSRR
jgi:hypothetical protein